MDELYVNAEEISSNHRMLKRELKTSEDIYVNHEVVRTVQPGMTVLVPPGTKFVEKNSCRAAVILLGLLCLLLLIGLITLVFLFTHGQSRWDMEEVMLHKRYNNLTRERNELQTSYNNMENEQDQLQTSYNNLTTERDQLQTSYNDMVKDRDRLQKRFEDMTKNRDDLQRKFQNCQQIWIYFSGSLYYISSNEKSWQESRQDCLQKSADLMVINSHEEQNFVNQLKKYLWIGLTDSETEGTWKWVDGTPMNTSYWNSGEPNGARNENCGQIKMFEKQNSWNDEGCSVSHFWICEKRASP